MVQKLVLQLHHSVLCRPFMANLERLCAKAQVRYDLGSISVGVVLYLRARILLPFVAAAAEVSTANWHQVLQQLFLSVCVLVSGQGFSVLQHHRLCLCLSTIDFVCNVALKRW